MRKRDFVLLLVACGCVWFLGRGLLIPGGHSPDFYLFHKARNQLRQIGPAIVNRITLHPRTEMMPPAIVDAEGKPLLSWRVRLLPLLGEEELYAQFDLSKPWDSPENLPLVEKMPGIYASRRAGVASIREGRTPYKALVDPQAKFNTAWFPGLRWGLKGGFEDGIISTAMVVEDLSAPVIWTKPEEVTPEQFLGTLDHGGWSSREFILMTGDGTVITFTDPTTEEILPYMYVNDGKVPKP